MNNNFYKNRCEHLEKMRECQDVVVGIKDKKIENLESIIKEQERYTKLLQDSNRELLIENDALKEKCEK